VDGPVLLCGLGRVGWRVLDCLRTAGVPVVAVDTVADPADPRLFGVRLARGDCRDQAVLDQAGVRSARGVIIVTSDDLVNISCALMVRRLAPDARIVLRMFNQNLVTRLGKAVSNVTALSVSALSAPLLALTATTGEVLAAFPVGNDRRQVAEVAVAAESQLVGRRVGAFDEQNRYLLLAHTPPADAPRLLHDIDPDAGIEPGDRLVVAGTPNDVRRLLEPGWDDPDVLWAGKLRRWWRVAYRTISEIETPVKACAVVVLLVVLGSAAVYRYGLGRPWYDGLYQTISVIFTGSDLGGTDYEGWAKVFVSLLKMFGTVAVAAFTAIFTNYLIRARLGGVFEVRRIPDSGHVVVIGLGNVGYRVVEELGRMGERPVVVEGRADNPFVASCRRKGVPVVTGDATVRETLQQAHVKDARAVIACTSADLVNLEIALLVAELNEKQRVVVRLGDSVLAETARTAAGVKMAVSLPELAAPAFVAALLGDRVLSMFLVGGRMLAAIEIAVHGDDVTLVGHSLRAVAIDYGLAPVAVVGPDGKERAGDTAYRLHGGDRLTAVAAVADLDRVTRRAPVPAEWSVEVTGYPLSARDELALRARALRGLTAEAAAALVAGAPFVLADRQTRGQAEELLGALHREKVSARLATG
jgi:Trk K+ transport system NAD-binding subunit